MTTKTDAASHATKTQGVMNAPDTGNASWPKDVGVEIGIVGEIRLRTSSRESSNAKLTDDEERAKDVRIGSRG